MLPLPAAVLAWIAFGVAPAIGQMMDDGSQIQSSRITIGSGWAAGDLAALGLDDAANKVEITVGAGETANAIRDRLVTAANAHAGISALATAAAGGTGEIILTGETSHRP